MNVNLTEQTDQLNFSECNASIQRRARIEKLRTQALGMQVHGEEFFYKFYRSYKKSEVNSDSPDITSEFARYADAFYDMFSQLTPTISEDELIVGEFAHALSPEEQKDWEDNYLTFAQETAAKSVGGQDSHMTIDYDLVLQKGLRGISSDIDKYLIDCNSQTLETLYPKEAFYKCCQRCLESVMVYSEHYAEEAEKLAAESTDSRRHAELLEIARICRKVPAEPAETFYEAVQSVHFITHCLSINPILFRVMQQFQLGHPDRYLLSFYEKDLAEGRITREEAQLLLDCLGIQINMRVPNGLSSGYMVGGRDTNGQIVANDLTEMCMQVIDDIRLVYPAVGLCWTEGMEQKYLDTACEILSHGRSHPAIFNDDIISKGLMSYGVPAKEAHNYIHSTCVEITPVAASNVWVASPYTNMAQLLLDTLDREYEDFEALHAALFDRLDHHIRNNFERLNEIRQSRAAHSINPLLSCLVNDCLERGLDIEQGGARYNWIMPSFVGVANLVDSLYAVKYLVFDQKEMTIGKLKEILARNFEGEEALRLRLLNNLPKYGNDLDEIDSYFERITGHIIAQCKKYKPMHSQGRLIPSVFCWEMHERFGRETGATPDGRTAGFPLGDGSGPCQGREMKGPTASILSSTKWPHHELIGGVAVNMKFSKRTLGTRSIDTMRSLILTYLARGGFELQINVVDTETLKEARKNPDSYRDLVVRIGGYSDYFVKLSPQMQDELILRTAHEL